RHPRMVDVELLLRFMAFHRQTYLKHPDKDTKSFLNTQMELGGTYTERQLEKDREIWRQALKASLTVFGKHAFRRFVPGPSESPGGKWDSRINRALMDVELYWFTLHKIGPITRHSDALNEAALRVMTDPEFIDLTSHTISEHKRVKKRFEM